MGEGKGYHKKMTLKAFCPGPPSQPLENTRKIEDEDRTMDRWMRFFLMVSKGLKRSLPSVPAHVFLLISRLLKYCTTASASLSAGCCPCCVLFCKSLVLCLGETVIAQGSWRHLLCHPSFWIFWRLIQQFTTSAFDFDPQKKKQKTHLWVSCVLLACSLDPTKIGGPLNNLTVVHPIQRNLQTTSAHDTRLVATESETWTK